jgi:hypothetical protein
MSSQRSPDGSLPQTLDEPEHRPPPHRVNPIGTAANGADAVPAFAEVYERGREVLGADADAVTAKLLSAYDGDAESALDTPACAVEESNPRQYIESDIEAAVRDQTRRPGRR